MSASPATRIDHLGYVVDDLEVAGRFFVDVLGFTRNEVRQGQLREDDGDGMTRRFGVHPRAVARYAFYSLGDGHVELLQWASPIRDDRRPTNQDAGGRHIAIATADMAASLDRVRAFGGCDIRDPNAAGFIYVKTPFGLEVQLVPSK